MEHADTPSAIVWTLPFFSDLTDQEKSELLKVASFRHFKKNEMIFLSGDPMTHVYWVCSGMVQKYRETPDGHELTSAIRIIGDALFDPNSLQHRRNHTMNARAMEYTTLFAVPMPWLDEHMKSWDHLANKFLDLISQRAQEARIEVEHQETMNAAQIIACFLQHLCVLHHFDPRGFTLPYSKSIIASRLGMELESFSRVLPKLRDLGIIVRGKEVSFTGIATAQRFSCGSCSVTEDCSTHQAMQKLTQNTSSKSKQLA